MQLTKLHENICNICDMQMVGLIGFQFGQHNVFADYFVVAEEGLEPPTHGL